MLGGNDGDIAPGDARLKKAIDFARDPGIFGGAIDKFVTRDASWLVGTEIGAAKTGEDFVNIVGGGETIADLNGDLTGEVENFGGAAIVFGEGDDFSVVVRLKIKQITGGGALKGVNCLIVITDGHNRRLVIGSEKLDKLELRGIGVLEFVE